MSFLLTPIPLKEMPEPSRLQRLYRLSQSGVPMVAVGDVHYHEAVRRGSVLLTVEVGDESQTDVVRAALNDAGAVDIDERVAQWRSSGYSGYDPSAKEYSADEIAAERKAFDASGKACRFDRAGALPARDSSEERRPVTSLRR